MVVTQKTSVLLPKSTLWYHAGRPFAAFRSVSPVFYHHLSYRCGGSDSEFRHPSQGNGEPQEQYQKQCSRPSIICQGIGYQLVLDTGVECNYVLAGGTLRTYPATRLGCNHPKRTWNQRLGKGWEPVTKVPLHPYGLTNSSIAYKCTTV